MTVLFFYSGRMLHNTIWYLQDSGLTPKKYVVRLYIEPRYKQIRITNCVGSFLQVKLLLNFPHSNILGQGHNGLFYKHERGIKSFWISSLALKIWLRAYQKSGGVSSKHIPEEENIATDAVQKKIDTWKEASQKYKKFGKLKGVPWMATPWV